MKVDEHLVMRCAAAWLSVAVAVTGFLGLAGVESAAATSEGEGAIEAVATASPSSSPGVEDAQLERPEWFGLEMTDVRTGDPFTIDDFAGQGGPAPDHGRLVPDVPRAE